MRLPDALAWLDAHHNRELVPGGTASGADGLSLEAMTSLCALLGEPQRAYPVVHVTGTNGKGSVTAMISGLLAAHGLRVGTYTSPHLRNVNERIACNGEPIGDEDFVAVLADVAARAELVGQTLSWFEIVTAAALSWFATIAVDVAVVEVGMLGRHDATNVVDAAVAVVTNVGRDHTDGVGDWEMAVASEKAGIVGPDSVLVLGGVAPRLRPLFEAEGPAALWAAGEDFAAEAVRAAVGGQVADLRTPLARFDDVFITAHGPHQADNAAMAVTATEAFFDRPLDPALVAEVLGSLQLPGRFEVLGHQPLVVLDGAHNPPAAEALVQTLASGFHTSGRRVLVWGMLADRDPAAFLDALEPARVDAVVACSVPSPRAAAASDLAAVARARGLACEVVDDPVEAVRRAVDVCAEDDLVLVTGSLYLVGALTKSPGGASGP